MRDLGWAVVAHHHVCPATGNDRRFLLAGDLLLRPPVVTVSSERLVQTHSATAGEPDSAVPVPAVPAWQMVDIRPHGYAPVPEGVAGQLRQLREVLVVPVDEPQLGVDLAERRVDGAEVALSVVIGPDAKVA